VLAQKAWAGTGEHRVSETGMFGFIFKRVNVIINILVEKVA
jgi:hypothetical protein